MRRDRLRQAAQLLIERAEVDDTVERVGLFFPRSHSLTDDAGHVFAAAECLDAGGHSVARGPSAPPQPPCEVPSRVLIAVGDVCLHAFGVTRSHGLPRTHLFTLPWKNVEVDVLDRGRSHLAVVADRQSGRSVALTAAWWPGTYSTDVLIELRRHQLPA
ncbi:MAG: hypothetical protein JO147_09190 [Actinobacteria bacterium]|nr:hypothetical protein [Actinomycetota bacterium]